MATRRRGRLRVWESRSPFEAGVVVQRVPRLPSREEAGDAHVVVQPGPYDSLWVRLLLPLEGSRMQSDFLALVQALAGLDDRGDDGDETHLQWSTEAPRHSEATHSTRPPPQQAPSVHVALAEEAVHGEVVVALKALAFRFHHFNPDACELVYYRWCAPREDMVPAYATSIEGGGLLVLSPDEQQVLTTWEHGMWMFPGGAVGHGERMLDAAIRETREEVGVTRLDRTFPCRLVASWHQPRARDNHINDNYRLFIAKAKTRDFQVDGHEIHRATWRNIDPLLQALHEVDARDNRTTTTTPAVSCADGEVPCASESGASSNDDNRNVVTINGEPFAEPLLRGLANYRAGRWFECHERDCGNPVIRHCFW